MYRGTGPLGFGRFHRFGRQQQLGRGGQPQQGRRRHRLERHAPRDPAADHLVPDGAAVHRRERQAAPHGRHHLARLGARHHGRQQWPRGVGLHQQLRRLHRPRRARDRPGQRRAGAHAGRLGDARQHRRDDPRQRRRGGKIHRARKLARALARSGRAHLCGPLDRAPAGIDQSRAPQAGDGRHARRGAGGGGDDRHPGAELRGRRRQGQHRLDHHRHAAAPGGR